MNAKHTPPPEKVNVCSKPTKHSMIELLENGQAWIVRQLIVQHGRRYCEAFQKELQTIAPINRSHEKECLRNMVQTDSNKEMYVEKFKNIHTRKANWIGFISRSNLREHCSRYCVHISNKRSENLGDSQRRKCRRTKLAYTTEAEGYELAWCTLRPHYDAQTGAAYRPKSIRAACRQYIFE